jgi:transposase
MPKACSVDLRERAVSRVVAGESVRSVAAVLEVSVSSVVKWSQRYRATGSVAPGRAGGRPRPSPLAVHRVWLLERIGSGEHVTLRGLQAELAERGTQVDYRTVWNFVHAEGLSFKKNRSAKRTTPS